MKTKTLIAGIALATLIGVTVAVPAMAHGVSGNGCEMELKYDVRLSPNKLVLSQQGDESYRFEPGRLFVKGAEVKLDVDQRLLVDNYADSIARQVPEVISLMTDALTLASNAVNSALTPLLGDESSAKVSSLMANVGERLDRVMHRDGDSYFIGASDEPMDAVFDKEFEREVENLVQDSLGSLMIKLGTEILSAEGGSFEAKMEAFGNKMDALGEQIEQGVEAEADGLEARADTLCDAFAGLQAQETELRAKVPALSGLALVGEETVSSDD